MPQSGKKEEVVVKQELPAVAEVKPPKDNDRINRYTFLFIIIVFGLLLYFSLSQFFTAFLGAVIFYILGRRRMDKMVKKGWKKPLAAMVVILLSLIIIMLPIFIAGYLLYNKGKYYMANPDMLVESLKRLQQQLQQNYKLNILSDKNIDQIQTFATNTIQSLLGESLDFLASITMLYFFLYFMLIGINRMEAAIVFYLPFQRRKIEMFGRELKALTFSNSIGVPAIAVAQGLVGYVAYLITGLPEAGFWAVITAFSSIIPIVGTGLVWVPAALYMLFIHHTWQGIFLLAWGALVLGITDNVVRFVLAKKMADVHPIITVLGVIMGLKYFGLAGLVFGPVLISFFVILLKIYYVEYQRRGEMISRKKVRPIRFNLPFLGTIKRRKRQSYANKRSKEPPGRQ